MTHATRWPRIATDHNRLESDLRADMYDGLPRRIVLQHSSKSLQFVLSSLTGFRLGGPGGLGAARSNRARTLCRLLTPTSSRACQGKIQVVVPQMARIGPVLARIDRPAFPTNEDTDRFPDLD